MEGTRSASWPPSTLSAQQKSNSVVLRSIQGREQEEKLTEGIGGETELRANGRIGTQESSPTLSTLVSTIQHTAIQLLRREGRSGTYRLRNNQKFPFAFLAIHPNNDSIAILPTLSSVYFSGEEGIGLTERGDR